tara:strand:+ start:468 stop:905 length:438 start_codon:yes stop_codon:yes gene_type:complete
MNYNRPAAGGTSLTYPIEQTTIDLSNKDFTKLNTSPITILPSSTELICPINITVQYDNIDGSSFILIGFESLLGPSLNQAWLSIISGSIINGATGVQTLGIQAVANYFANTKTNEPLVLWSDSDDIFLTFTKFIVTITYLKIPNL